MTASTLCDAVSSQRPHGTRAAGSSRTACSVETSLCKRMEFRNFDDYWAPYAGQDGPGAEYVRSLDEAERERMREAVRDVYLDGESDGLRSYAAVAWAVKGRAPGHRS